MSFFIHRINVHKDGIFFRRLFYTFDQVEEEHSLGIKVG